MPRPALPLAAALPLKRGSCLSVVSAIFGVLRERVYQSAVGSSSNSSKMAVSKPASYCSMPSAYERDLPSPLPCCCVAGGGAFPVSFSLPLFLLRRFLLL